MAGIYLHIPFCKQACHYCNFHFSTSLGNQEALIEALVKEIEIDHYQSQAPFRLDIHGLPAGSYWLKIEDTNSNVSYLPLVKM